jgi:hypothetical protein
VAKWLTENLNGMLALNCSVWIIGSVLIDYKTARDCDVLMLFDIENLEEILKISPVIKKDFFDAFNLNLHLTRLTWNEAKECKEFLSSVFARPNMKLM